MCAKFANSRTLIPHENMLLYSIMLGPTDVELWNKVYARKSVFQDANGIVNCTITCNNSSVQLEKQTIQLCGYI